ncbi:MAG TPA: MurR/RpiR family transcriptional regulator [Lachnospiraceae bacterium]
MAISCLKKIQSKIDYLTAAEQKVGYYILEHGNEVLSLTVTELAEKSNSSDATVVRFCRSIGYKGYQEFKIGLAQDAILPYKHLNTQLEETDSVEKIFDKIIRSEIDVLEETRNVLELSELQRAVDVIKNASRIVIVGCGGSMIVGQDAMHKFLKVGIRCIAQMDVDLQAMEVSLATKEDVVLGISHSGTNRSTVAALQLAKKNGVSTIGLTTQGKSPMQKYCDIVLKTATKETTFKSESVTARIAQLSVIDTIVAVLSLQDSEKSYKAIQKTRSATANRKF